MYSMAGAKNVRAGLEVVDTAGNVGRIDVAVVVYARFDGLDRCRTMPVRCNSADAGTVSTLTWDLPSRRRKSTKPAVYAL